MRKKTIEIRLDFRQGPIWLTYFNTGEPITGIDIVDNDEEIRKINYEISHLYDSYYEFDSHGQACWFNLEKEKKDKEKMLMLLKKLNDRLNEINDDSFVIKDFETERVKML